MKNRNTVKFYHIFNNTYKYRLYYFICIVFINTFYIGIIKYIYTNI